jgi:hypothetical protein
LLPLPQVPVADSHAHTVSVDSHVNHTTGMNGESQGDVSHVSNIKKSPMDDGMHMRKFDWDDDVPVTSAKHAAPTHGTVGDSQASESHLTSLKKSPVDDGVNMRKFDWDDDVPVHSIRHADIEAPVGLHGESNGQEASFSGLKKGPTDDSLHMRKFDWDDDVPVRGIQNGAFHNSGAVLQQDAIAINISCPTLQLTPVKGLMSPTRIGQEEAEDSCLPMLTFPVLPELPSDKGCASWMSEDIPSSCSDGDFKSWICDNKSEAIMADTDYSSWMQHSTCSIMSVSKEGGAAFPMVMPCVSYCCLYECVCVCVCACVCVCVCDI